MNARSPLMLISAAIFAYSADAKVARISFEELVQSSDVIVEGKVVRVHKHEDIRIAEVDIEVVLKGSVELDSCFFLASPTWTCDVSDAVVDERAVLFLSANTARSEPRKERPENLRPFYSLAHSGRGRVPIEIVNGIEQITFPSDVALPSSPQLILGKNGLNTLCRLTNFESEIVSVLTDTKRKEKEINISEPGSRTATGIQNATPAIVP